MILRFFTKQHIFRMPIVRQIIWTLLSFWHKAQKSDIIFEIGKEAVKYHYFDQVKYMKNKKFVTEFGYPKYEANDDNLDAQIDVAM